MEWLRTMGAVISTVSNVLIVRVVSHCNHDNLHF